MSERVGAAVSGSGLRTGLVCGRQTESEVCGHRKILLCDVGVSVAGEAIDVLPSAVRQGC